MATMHLVLKRDMSLDLPCRYSHALPTEAWTCINLGGVDETGEPFTKTVPINAGFVNSLWFGVQVPIDAEPGAVLTGNITLYMEALASGEALPPASVAVSITVNSDSMLLPVGCIHIMQ